MGRFRLFVVAAIAATITGSTAPVTAAATPAAPGHPARPPAEMASLHGAVQWLPSADGRLTGIVHYPSGLIAHVAPRRRVPTGPAGVLRQAARPRRPLAGAATALAAPAPVESLGGDARITGRVTDSDHQPLAGVQVDVFVSGSYEPALTTATNANGHYSVALAGGTYFVEFDGSSATGGNSDATGYVGTGDSIQLPSAGHVVRNETLHPGAQLRVRVTDRAGNPLADVAPEVRPITPYVHSLVGGLLVIFGFETDHRTGPDGTFTFRGLPADAARVCFTAEFSQPTGGVSDRLGYANRCSRRPVAPAAGTSTTYPTVRLSTAPGGTLTGVVTNANGNPVGNAEVSANGRTDGEFATTDSDGSYRISGLRPGRFRVCVDETDESTGSPRFGSLPGCRAERVEVRGGEVSTADITLRPGGAIAGAVTGPSGAPVQNAFVYAAGSRPRQHGIGFTDADGRYRLTGLPAGDYRVCVDSSEAIDADNSGGDQPDCRRSRVSVRVRAVRKHVDLQLAAGGAIVGRVTDAGGAGVAGAQVAFGLTTDERVGGLAIADADGNYRLGGLPAGSYDACITVFEPDGNITQRCPDGQTEVSIGAVAEQDLTLAPPAGRGSIAVTVRDAQGRPVQGVNVVVLKPCARPDPIFCASEPLFGHPNRAKLVDSRMVDNAGRGQSDGRKPGSYAVCLFAYYAVTTAGALPTGYTDRCAGQTFTVSVQAGVTTHVHLILHPAGRVEGQVVDGAGHPISQALVHISHAAPTDYEDPFGGDPFFDEPGIESPLLDAETQKNGTFSIRGVRPGGIKVCVQPPFGGHVFGRCIDRAVTVTANAKTVLGDITLPSAGAIAGTVRDAAGKPLHRGAAVAFRSADRTQVAGVAFVHPDGHYRLTGLKTGHYGVCFGGVPHHVIECYDQVRWHIHQHPFPPKNVTAISVLVGHTTRGIDAVLPRRK